MRKLPFKLLVFLTSLLLSGSLYAQTSWSTDLPGVGTFSSPRITDLNKDGVGDVIIGAGREEFHACDSAVIALDGKTGQLLWNIAAKDQIFGSAALKDITNDGIKDAFIGGRSAELIAINGATGQEIWRFKADQHTDTKWFNFYNPQFVSDQDGDGYEDILVANGGDVMVAPYDTNRPPGYLVVISSKKGDLLAKAEMPDGKEIYMSATVSPAYGQKDWEIVFGTGGETVGGNLYLGYLSQVMREDLSEAILLHESEHKGYIGPAARIDLTKDGILDIVCNAVDGQLLAFNGKDQQVIWEVKIPSTEAYSSVALGQFTEDDIPDVFMSYGQGTWPKLSWSLQTMVNGATGTIEFTDSMGLYQNTTPLVFDVDGNGIDEVIMSLNYHEFNELYQKFFYTTFIVIGFQTKEIVQFGGVHEGSNLSSTPWLGDLDQDGFLDIISCHGTNLRHTYTFDGMKINRLSTKIPISKSIKWGAYQGSNYDGVYKQ